MNIIHDKLHDTAPMPLCWSSEKPFILNTKGKFRKTTGNWMFNHFGPFFSGFFPYTLFRSWDRPSIFRDLDTECLVKIWPHNSKWFWSYVNLFFCCFFFADFRDLRTWEKTGEKKTKLAFLRIWMAQFQWKVANCFILGRSMQRFRKKIYFFVFWVSFRPLKPLRTCCK